MIRYMTTVLFFIAIIFGCSTEQTRSIEDRKAEVLCNRLNQIQILPLKQGEHVDDPVYNSMLDAGDSMIPCLIEKISDTREMADPTQMPSYGGVFTIGDAAFLVLLDILGQECVEAFLPESVKRKFETQGIYAYYDFVEDTNNRRMIQENIRRWLSDRNNLQEEERLKNPCKTAVWKWPDEIKIKKIFENPDESGDYIALIEVDKRARYVRERETFEGLEVISLDGVRRCLLLKAIELNEDKEFCLEKEQ